MQQPCYKVVGGLLTNSKTLFGQALEQAVVCSQQRAAASDG
jgi:hypothetical protein